MSLFDNSNLVFAIFAIMLFIVLVLVYMMFGPLPNQRKFLSEYVDENVSIVGLLDLQTDAKYNNIAIGKNAGTQLIASGSNGTQNTVVGSGSGNSITTGDSNTMFGYGTGQNIVNGSNNTFIGNKAGLSTTGDDNTFIGSDTGTLNTTGIRNTNIGSGAGSNNTGDKNIFLGYNAGIDIHGIPVTNASNSFYISTGITSVSGGGSLPSLPAGYVMLAYNTVTGQVAPITT